jgi:uncharacterized protein
MDQKEIIEIVIKYINLIKTHFKLRLVVLYGSYSRGNQHTDSDIDVAVFIKNEKNQDHYVNTVKLYKLRMGIDDRIEPNLFYFDENGYEPASFENYIIQNGIVMYKNDELII